MIDKSRRRIFVFCKDYLDFKNWIYLSEYDLIRAKSLPDDLRFNSRKYSEYIAIYKMEGEVKDAIPHGIIITENFKHNPEYEQLSGVVNLILHFNELYKKDTYKVESYYFINKQ